MTPTIRPGLLHLRLAGVRRPALIEPLETREVKKVRDFVIVLDTSDSTSGALVKAFLKETFTLLKTADRFFTHCNILVLQCDDAVRAETWLTELDQLERYLGGLPCAAAAEPISGPLLPGSTPCAGRASCRI